MQGIYNMLTKAKTNICDLVSTKAKLVVPRRVASIIKISSFLKRPKISSIPVMWGKPNHVDVIGARKLLMGLSKLVAYAPSIRIPEIITMGPAIKRNSFNYSFDLVKDEDVLRGPSILDSQ